jgi:tight adherence protein B
VAERRAAAGRHLAVTFALFVAVLCALAAPAAQAASLNGWLGSGAVFPNRALVLIPPAASSVSATSLHVTENRSAVRGLSVIPTTQAGPGDFGLVVVLERNASTAVVAATRQLAGLRGADQEMGVVGLGSQPRLLAPLGTDTAATQTALGASSSGQGTNVPAAIRLALTKLRQARVALGAIVVISDGVGKLSPGTPTPAAVSAAAAVARIPIFTVGVQDRAATAGTLAALRSAAPGQFVQAPPSRLAGILKDIYGVVTHGYVARWHSVLPPGTSAHVVARIDHVAGSVVADYQVPAARSLAHKAANATPPGAAPGQPGSVATSGRLSPTPAFAQAPTTPASPAPAGASAGAPAVTPAAPAAAPVSFWSSGMGTLSIAGIVGAFVAAAVSLALDRPSRRGVRVRVGSFVQMTAETAADDVLGVPVAPSKSIVHRLENSERWRTFALDVEIARSQHTPIALVKRALVMSLVVAGLAVVLTGSDLVGFVPLVGWWFVLKSMMKRAANKQREKFRVTLPGYLQDLASAIRVGRSLVAALTVVAESAEEPTKSELERAITDEALGRPLDASLEAVAVRMEAPDLDQVALVAALNRRSGSNVAEALDRVSEGARERQDLKREVQALTSQAKMSSWVLTALPGVLLLMLSLVSPRYASPLFHTTAGVVLCFVGAAMVFAGWKALKKITDVRI